MCSREFFRARVGIVIGAVPIDGSVLGDHFVAALSGHGHGRNLAEAAQAVGIVRAAAELRDFQRAAQVHVQAGFFGFAIERRGAMNHRLGRAHQARVFGGVQPEVRVGQVAAIHGNARFEGVAKFRKIHVQLQGVPQPLVRFLLGLRADQQIQPVGVALQQNGGDVRADVAGRTGQKDGHGLGLSPRARRRARMRQLFAVLRSVSRVLRRKNAPRPRFRRAPFDQRVHPPAQRGNMDVNPIIPPVNRGRIITEGRALVLGNRRRKQLHVFGFKHLLIVQDKRLVEFDEFFDADQVAFLAAPAEVSSSAGRTRRG